MVTGAGSHGGWQLTQKDREYSGSGSL